VKEKITNYFHKYVTPAICVLVFPEIVYDANNQFEHETKKERRNEKHLQFVNHLV
jgi:hypothetical protein